jgi:beta-N-acetylhexosaminidase
MAKRRIILATVAAVLVIAIIFVFSPLGQMIIGKLNPGTISQEPTTPEPEPTKTPLACVSELPNKVKVAQKLLFAVYSDQVKSETPILAAAHIGGVIIMTPATAKQIAALKDALSIAPLIGVDQEGGVVQRYTSEGIVPGAAEMANNYSANQAYTKYFADSTFLRGLGVTTNFAPVVDVLSGDNNPLPGRLYSSNATTVTEYAGAAIRAANDAGITPVIKHFPGLGSANGNTDYGSAKTDSLAVLKTRDLIPYQKLAAPNVDVMVSNAVVPGLTNGQPAVWSAAAVALLRDMGYQNAVVYTDSLTAKAIPGTLADAVVKSWQAGVDISVVVQTRQDTPQLNDIVQDIITSATRALRAGLLDQDEINQSLVRIFARKGINPCDISL